MPADYNNEPKERTSIMKKEKYIVNDCEEPEEM